ncbi:MAG: thioredoxin family protein [Bacteroidota bacterium]
MRRKYILLSILLVCLFATFNTNAANSDTTKLYSITANATKDIAAAVKQAKAENKHVIIQAGGNWCSWCLLFEKTVKNDFQLDSAIKANFIVYHLNYSKENQNDEVFAKYGFPQRMGFPVFLILDKDGKLIHTQNSSYLEEGKGYNKSKVIGFFGDWSVGALDPKNYPTQKK